MRIFIYTVFLLTALILLACRQPEKEKEVMEIESSSFIVEDAEPPPPNCKAGVFNSVEHWLTNICEEDQPKVDIDEYSMGLFEGEDYHLFLVGKQDSVVGNDHYSNIVFKPQSMYYKLPKAYYVGLSREQMLLKLTDELKKVVSSNRFKNCFLSKAKSFIIDYSGENLVHH